MKEESSYKMIITQKAGYTVSCRLYVDNLYDGLKQALQDAVRYNDIKTAACIEVVKDE